jgi:carotenoid cleavage dioxygenase-like enzyme
VETYFGVKPADGRTSFGHDMMFTENWIILYHSSVHIDVTQIFNETGNLFDWKPEATLKIGLVPRFKEDGADIQTNYTSDDVVWLDVGTPHAIVHPLNAWEEDDGTVVMWTPMGDSFNMNIDDGANYFYMAELRMDPVNRTITKMTIEDKYNVEFPRVREDFLGRFARYGTSGIMDVSEGGDGLFVGYNVWDMHEKKLHQVVRYKEGDLGGEPVLIPKPGSTDSGAFYVATFVFNKIDESSSFVMYDSETGEVEVRLKIPISRVPFGFHGRWITGTQLENHISHHAAASATMSTMSS